MIDKNCVDYLETLTIGLLLSLTASMGFILAISALKSLVIG